MNAQQLEILLIDDDEDSLLITQGLLAQVHDARYRLQWVGNYEAGLEALRRGGHDACLVDYRLGARDGLELLRQAQSEGCRTPIIMLTGQGEHAIDVQAMKAGAADYLAKEELDAARLERSLRFAIERQQLMARLEALASAEHRSRLELEQAHTELKKTYDELKRAQAQLIRTEKLSALGQLVAGVAHEINNPLAFVNNNMSVLQRDMQAVGEVLALYAKGNAALAEHDSALYQRIQECVEQMDLPYTLANFDQLLVRSISGLKRIQHLIKGLRDFARDAVVPAVQAEVDLNAEIEAALGLVQFKAEARQVVLETDLAPLPPVGCRPGRINQVVVNLAANAVEACAAGGKVIVQSRLGTNGVEIHVLDTGCGIDPSIMSKIFDPFFTTKPQGQGMGLGLSISHGIVAEHGGRFEVASSPGRGAHFVVYLPLTRPSLPELGASTTTTSARTDVDY